MYHVAVCDDEIAVCSWIENIILRYGKTKSELIKTDVYYSGEELYKYMKRNHYYDLIFLDIELKMLGGVEIGRIIRDEMKNENTKLVYISGKSDYAMDLFKVRPMDFLVKPLLAANIEDTLKKAMELSNRTSRVFQFKSGYDTMKVPIPDIMYFKSNNREVTLAGVNQEMFFYGTLKEIYSQLKEYNFFYSHKSYLINYSHVIRFEYDNLVMSDHSVLPISQPKRKEIRKLQREIEKDEY